jgi:hypothetical protein
LLDCRRTAAIQQGVTALSGHEVAVPDFPSLWPVAIPITPTRLRNSLDLPVIALRFLCFPVRSLVTVMSYPSFSDFKAAGYMNLM